MHNPSQVMIRAADMDDCEVIVEFNRRLAEESEGKSLESEQLSAGVQTLLAHPHHGRYFVACAAERVVGQLMHTKEWSDWRNGEIWWLQSVYVDPGYRRSGVFRSLFQHLEQLARSTPNVIGLRLYAEEQNLKALEAYRALGLSPAGYLVMERFFERTAKVDESPFTNK